MGISKILLQQRLRNRIIEVLSLLCGEQHSIRKVGTAEILERWWDYVDEDKLGFFSEPVFSYKELKAIKVLHQLIEDRYKAIPNTFEETEMIKCKEWVNVTAQASKVCELFNQRGQFDEEYEIKQ